MYFVILAFTFAIVSSYLLWMQKKNLKYKSLEDIKGPENYPFGSIFSFGFTQSNWLKNLNRLANIYSPTMKLKLGPNNVYLCTTDTDLVEAVLTSPVHLKKSPDYQAIKPVSPNGLLINDGLIWKIRRKALTPAFHIKILDSMLTSFYNHSNIFTERLANFSDKGIFDAYPLIFRLTSDIISEYVFGVDKSDITQLDIVADNIWLGRRLISERITTLWMRSDILYQFSNNCKQLTEVLKILHTYCHKIINERRAKMLRDSSPYKKKQELPVLVDILLNGTVDGKKLTDDDIKEELMTILIAGQDTTASLVACTLHQLGNHPEIQNKVYMEAKEIYGDDFDKKPTIHDLNEMKYLDLVIKESMRRFPPAPYISRQLEEDLDYKGRIIPKGTNMLIFIYGIHHREDLFEDPFKFDPERFITRDEKSFSYIPMSAGPRNCIGQKFGIFESKMIISKFILKYELLPLDASYDIELFSDFSMTHPNGVHLNMRKRTAVSKL